MIYFYDKILPKFSQLTDKGENYKIESLNFLLSVQEYIIKNCNNKDFWIKINKEYIGYFIDNLEKEYENGKNYFKDNANEIKRKIIESLEKEEEEKNQIKKNKTLTVCKSLSNIKDCEPPAPITNIKNIELKTSRIYKKKNIEKYNIYNKNHKCNIKESRRLNRNNTEKNLDNYIIKKDKKENLYLYQYNKKKMIKKY